MRMRLSLILCWQITTCMQQICKLSPAERHTLTAQRKSTSCMIPSGSVIHHWKSWPHTSASHYLCWEIIQIIIKRLHGTDEQVPMPLMIIIQKWLPRRCMSKCKLVTECLLADIRELKIHSSNVDTVQILSIPSQMCLLPCQQLRSQDWLYISYCPRPTTQGRRPLHSRPIYLGQESYDCMPTLPGSLFQNRKVGYILKYI